MNTYSVTKIDENEHGVQVPQVEFVQATSMQVDMGCLQFFGPQPGMPDTKILVKAYGIGGWINAEIKYP